MSFRRECAANAKAAAFAWASQATRYRDLAYEGEPLHTYARGHPKKDQPRDVTQVSYGICCVLEQKAAELGPMITKSGCIVLLINVAKEGEGAADLREVLSLYKEPHRVEQNFAFLTDPAVVNAISLKRKSTSRR